MSATVLQPQSAAPTATRRRAPLRHPAGLAPLAGALLVALATAIVILARTRPGFDPYGWLVWGRQTLAGNLDTNAAPSWKPLPYLFTLLYSPFGAFQLWLWLVTAVAISLSGALFGARIAARLTRRAAPASRAAPGAAALLAGLGVLGLDNLAHYVLSAQSDPVIVALCLAAVDLGLRGRPRAALVAGTLAGLGRPEVWPLLAILGGWLALRRPRARLLVAACGAATLLLWFGIPALTSRTALVAAENAYGSGRRLHAHVVLGTLDRFAGLLPWPLAVAGAVAVLLALLRRERAVPLLGAAVALWVVVEVAFALHGWPGLARYMFEPAALTAVLGGVLLGRLVAAGRELARRPLHHRWRGGACLALAGALLAGVVPAAVSRVQAERRDLTTQHARTILFDALGRTVRQLGGAAALRRCGKPVVLLEDQTALAWQLGVNVSRVGFKLPKALRQGGPVLAFAPHGRVWHVRGYRERLAACRIAYPLRSGRSG